MATPQESITTVNGRRCTRSRARTALTTSTTPATSAAAAPPQVTSSTTVEAAPKIETSTSQAPPPPPPPSSTAPAPAPTTSAQQTAQPPPAVPTTSTTEAAATSAIGTSSPAPTSSERVTPLALATSARATAAAQKQPETQAAPEASSPAAAVPLAVSSQAAAASQVAVAVSSAPPPPPSPIPTSSDTEQIAVPTSLVASSRAPARFTAPAISEGATSNASPPLAIETDTNAQPSVTEAPAIAEPQPTTSLVDSTPTGGSAGIIAPEQGNSGDNSPLTFANGGNIGGIIGGVFGGVAGLALISVLLFVCLRKRKSRPVRWNEKQESDPSFLARLKTIPSGVGAFVARIKGNQSGPISNPYQRHAAQASVGSVYSRDSNGRGRSTSEPQGFFGVKRAGSSNSISSKKSERNLLRKKPSSISSNYRFPGIVEDTGSPNPFADPKSTLLVLNPDPRSAPVTPQVPVAAADTEPRDPFASIQDPPGAAPAWAQVPTHHHTRTISSVSALSSHPVSSFYTADNPFRDPPYAPPAPSQAVLPSHTRRSSMALPGFNALSTVDATSTFASRDSDMFFGEPGPSRPATNFFTPMPTGRTVRQSDPFDLDRPEVLGFTSVFNINRKEVAGNITRQPTRSKRTSSVGNWGNAAPDANNYGLFPRDSTKPPPWGPNGRR
ncbi:uncharacterized protein J4E78_005601 [Alternaria triticimaculans]|uniref:uncharacterized protein n=1 Tax=Alternaria triticimaculans TaxID=297637 RepID=UPI0020C30E13|nr:uncharacterized protein J4E78_005601 [Alternaria triticimaculans]KAI4659177.1 hypothetical protein J4E78_005601 [Alternaria triticimaculans]